MTGITLKLSFTEMCMFRNISGNIASVLLKSRENMYMVSGFVIFDLHKKLANRIAISFAGKRTVRLNPKECYSLNQFLNVITPDVTVLEQTVRMEIFTVINQKLI